MMEYLPTFAGFLFGMIFGLAITQKPIKIKCGTLEIEARGYRELRSIVELFKGEDPFAKFKGGPVQ